MAEKCFGRKILTQRPRRPAEKRRGIGKNRTDKVNDKVRDEVVSRSTNCCEGVRSLAEF